jgi:hypothetical protein
VQLIKQALPLPGFLHDIVVLLGPGPQVSPVAQALKGNEPFGRQEFSLAKQE